MTDLTDKQQAFINEYLKSWNATEAARQAGYKGTYDSLRAIGSQNLTKPIIASEIQQRIAEMKMSADEAITSLADIARGSIADFVTVQAGLPVVDFGKAERAGKMHLLKKITYGKGTISFELYDKQAALNTIAKHHGLLNEKIEIDINLVVQVVDALQSLGQDPAAVFNEIIARARLKHDAGS